MKKSTWDLLSPKQQHDQIEVWLAEGQKNNPTFYSPNYPPAFEGEVNEEPSMTVPDQTMTMRELVERFANGQPINGQTSEPLFDDDENQFGINLKTLDLTELEDLGETIAERIKATRATEAKEAIAKAAENKRIADEQAQKNALISP